MDDLVKELLQSGLTEDQVKRVFIIINKWTNTNYPVMGAVVESILRRNDLV